MYQTASTPQVSMLQIKLLLIFGPHGFYINTNVGLLVVFMAIKTPTHSEPGHLHKQWHRFRCLTVNAREEASTITCTSICACAMSL